MKTGSRFFLERDGEIYNYCRLEADGRAWVINGQYYMRKEGSDWIIIYPDGSDGARMQLSAVKVTRETPHDYNGAIEWARKQKGKI